jgi:hypothetical protein
MQIKLSLLAFVESRLVFFMDINVIFVGYGFVGLVLVIILRNLKFVKRRIE